MSRTAAAAAAAPAGGAAADQRGDPWILGPWRDLLLIIGTPVLILPLVAVAQGRLGIEDLALYVAAFGALGHHLPGMLRAYGDRELFERFKLRFVVAPIALGAAGIFFALHDLAALALATLVWGFWHALMQTYGFVRIYDAKRKSFALLTQRLDFAMCLAWFVTAILLSPSRVFKLVNYWHLRCGGPLPSAGVIQAVQAVAVVATAVTTGLFLWNVVRSWRAGRPVSPLKVLLLATSIGFWWWCNVGITNIIIGIAMFEIFHDVQYLSIVWVFNRGRVRAGAGGLTRFLFRRSGAFVGIYVGLVAAYGSMRLFEKGIDDSTFKTGLTGLIAASTLLHFYYDGFIWKVRERKTSAALGVEGGAAGGPLRIAHALKWAPLVLLVGALAAMEPRERQGNFRRLEGLVATMPKNPEVQKAMGDALRQFGERERALEHYERAFELGLETSASLYRAGELLVALGRHDEALDRLEAALALKPDLPSAHVQIGAAQYALGDLEASRAAYAAALALAPEAAEAHHGLARTLAKLGRGAEAVPHYREAVALAPTSAGSHYNLAKLLAELGRGSEAAAAYRSAAGVFREQDHLDYAALSLRRALELEPDDAAAHYRLGQVLEAQGQDADAARHYARAVRLAPDLADARARLDALRRGG